MKEAEGYKQVKDFLSHNGKNFSSGHVFNENFYIEYYVANELRYKGTEVINFQVQHPEYAQDIQIQNLDAEIYHTGFSPKHQDYSFDSKNNIFYIEQNNTKNKFGQPYKIKIHG
ncbi:MAG: hypothetical protein WCW84_06755 [Sulfurimonas sp.]|jgi:hypothetical protein